MHGIAQHEPDWHSVVLDCKIVTQQKCAKVCLLSVI